MKNILSLRRNLLCLLLQSPQFFLAALENRISNWSRMVRVVALVQKFKKIILSKIRRSGIKQSGRSTTLLGFSLLKEARTALTKIAQQRSCIKDEHHWLKTIQQLSDSNKVLGKKSKISGLDRFLDKDELFHVVGKLEKLILK